MNEMLKAMSTDMNIKPFRGETDVSFRYRLILSALGQWCLRSACAPITKHSQTILLNDLLEKYIKLFPEISTAFELSNGVPVTVFIRRVYEEIGYLFTDSSNKNEIAKYGKGIAVEKGNILFGICDSMSVAGLGIITNEKVFFPVDWREALIRDKLTWKQYLNNQYDIVLFEDRDIEENELEFFNPKSLSRPSSSWGKQMKTDMTVARKTRNGPFYKVMKFNGRILHCEIQHDKVSDKFALTLNERRRLYFALKKNYNNPLRAKFTKIDDEYSEMRIYGHLPNREYYLLLLCSWPDQYFSNRKKFIIKNCMISLVKEVLKNLAIEVEGE